MATSTTELILKFRGDSGDLKSTMAQVRAELSQTARTQTTVNKGELTMRQQLSAAQSLQRQRSAALISQWKQQESAARALASGVAPVSTNLQRVTDVMQTLARSTASIQGPLGGVAGRLSSVGSIAGEAAGGLGVVGVAAGVAAVAVTALSVAFIKLTISTAEFQGKFEDMSQQVGVSAETLSTLNILAKTTGGSIETVSASLALFQRNLEEAHDPTSKEAKLLKELGVTSLETETALRQALKGLFDLGVGAKQTDAVLQLFGRSGRFVNAILKESQGDLDAATDKFQRMGFIVSTEAAVAADKFNDTLTILGEQLAAIGRQLVTQTIPVFIAFFEDVSRAVSGNQDDWKNWSNVIEVEVAVALGALQGFVTWVASRFTMDLAAAIDNSIKTLLERAEHIRARITVEADMRRINALTDQLLGRGGRPGDRPKAKKAARDTSLQDATKEAALAEREALILNSADVAENKRALEEQTRDIQEFTRRAIELAEARHDAAIVRINAEQTALDQALANRLIKQKEYDIKNREIALQNAAAQQKAADDVFRLEQERDRQIAAAEQAARQRDEQIAAEADARIIKRIERRIEREEILESDGQQQIAAIIDEGFQRRKEALEKEDTAYSTTLERREEITAEIIRLDGERAFSAEEAARRIVKAQFDEQNAAAKGATRPRSVDPNYVDPAELKKLNEQDAFAVFRQKIQDNLGGAEQTAAIAGLQVMETVFRGVAQAVGEAVHAFVLFGTAGVGLKKFTATMIAEIAKMSAVQAVWELAQGVAMLALNFFWPDPKYALSAASHFQAAAIYGGMAVIAAGVGRSVAGNEFQAAGGSGSAGTGTAAGTRNPSDARTPGVGGSTQDRQPIDIARTPGQPQALSAREQSAEIAAAVAVAVERGLAGLVLRAQVTRDEGSTVSMWVENYRGNGIVRQMVKDDSG